MVMTRYDKVVAIARLIDAAKGDSEELKPDEYREKHGRCPDGYEYDPLTDKCMSKEGERKDEAPEEERDEETPDEEAQDERKADEEKDKAEETKDEAPVERPPSPKTAGDWLDGRKARGDYLEKLFNDDPEQYQKEADRMRESGELPDRETAELLVKIKNVDDLPPETLRDKEKLAKIIAQQDAQRKIEEMVLEKAENELKNLEKRREIAIKAGKKPPSFDPLKFLNDIEEGYNRKLSGDTEQTRQILEDEADEFAKIVSDAATRPGEPAYWWKKWWEKVSRPIPVWTPGQSKAFDDLGLDKLTGASFRRSSVKRAVAYTSPGITNMEPREIGFPPYDRDRKPRRYIADEPSGRPGFPPYDEVETVEYNDRDARMQGFPPYDGKGEPHDSETIGLPPYNRKPPHMGRGFPPYHDGQSVYEQRRRTVDLAVN